MGDPRRGRRNLKIFWVVLIGTPIVFYLFIVAVIAQMRPGY